MATYRITAPDGNNYDITAPDTASQDEVLAYAKANYAKQPQQGPDWKGTVGQAISAMGRTLNVPQQLMSDMRNDPAKVVRGPIIQAGLPMVGGLLGGPIGAAGGEFARQALGAAVAPDTVPKTGLGRFASVMMQGAVPALAEKALGAMPSLAQSAGRRALGFTKRFLNKPGALQKANDVAQTMLEEGVITPRGTDAMIGRAENLAETSGKSIGEGMKALDESGLQSFNPVNMAKRVYRELAPKFFGGAYDAERKVAKEVAQTVLAHGDEPMTFQSAQALKEKLQEVAYKYGASDSLKKDMYKRASGMVRQALEDSIHSAEGTLGLPSEPLPAGESQALALRQQALGKYSPKMKLGPYRGRVIPEAPLPDPGTSISPETYNQYLRAKKVYGATQQAIPALTNRLSSEAGNRFLTPTDILVSLPEMASGNLGKAAATIGLKEMIERPGTAAIAQLAHFLSKAPVSGAHAVGSGSVAALQELRRRLFQ